jgi:NADPH:quinone reductase-like Zn-dependent oxidoreductase
MRAWVLDEGSPAPRLADVPEPPVGSNDVKVALRASALNHLDLWIAKGMPAPPSYPHVLGADGAGVVVEAGVAVEHLEPGAEVVIDPSTSCGRCPACLAGDAPLCPDLAVVGEHRWGTHAERIVVPATNAVPKPDALPWAEAAAFGLVVASAVRLAHRGQIEAGTTALVVGVGGGSASAAFLVAIARRAIAYVTSSGDRARTWALERGAAGAFDSDGPFDEEVRAATQGRGVDVVVDNVGSVTFERSFGALARGGRLVTNGSTSGRTATIHLPTLFWRQLSVVGASMNDRREFAEATQLVATGRVEVPTETPVAFDRYPEAFERLASGDHLGKLVVNQERREPRISGQG